MAAKVAQVDRICPICGETYLVDPRKLARGRNITCSLPCSFVSRGRKNYKSVVLPCAMCGKPVTRCPSHMKGRGQKVYCSKECHYKARGPGIVKRVITKPYVVPPETRIAQAERMRNQNAKRKAAGTYAHTPETKRKLSIATSKAMADGRFPRVSGLEKEVGVILDTMGIAKIPQYLIRDDNGRYGAVIDFFLPDWDVAMEVNGTFWHADPRVYPNGPVKTGQRNVITTYLRKQTLLACKGIRLIEVWELDFRQNPEGAVNAALCFGSSM